MLCCIVTAGVLALGFGVLRRLTGRARDGASAWRLDDKREG
ncbi:MAG: hypothetical protein QNJ30_09560 [Kiloniellales bacterium]|nr:hypothetical protein [Kiloniellales bacterium]